MPAGLQFTTIFAPSTDSRAVAWLKKLSGISATLSSRRAQIVSPWQQCYRKGFLSSTSSSYEHTHNNEIRLVNSNLVQHTF